LGVRKDGMHPNLVSSKVGPGVAALPSVPAISTQHVLPLPVADGSATPFLSQHHPRSPGFKASKYYFAVLGKYACPHSYCRYAFLSF
jgi:hypothetical protein